MIRTIICIFFVFILWSSDLFAQNNRVDSLISELHKAVKDTNKVKLLNELSLAYRNVGELKLSIQYSDSALIFSTNTNYSKGKALAYQNIGFVYELFGNYPESITNYLAALQIAEEMKDQQLIAMMYNGIGIIYSRQSNYPEALKNYFLAIEHARNNDPRRIIRANNNIGIVYDKQKKYTDALSKYTEALKMSEELGDKQGIAMSSGNIANLYNTQHNYSESFKYHSRALKLFDSLGEKKSVALSYINIGDLLMNEAASHNPPNKQKYNDALSYIKRGLALALAIGEKFSIRLAYTNMAEVYKGLNDYEKAYEYGKLSYAIKDSLINNESLQKITRLKIQYEREKTIAEEKLKQDNLKQKNRFLMFAIAFLLLISVLIIMLFRQRSHKKSAVEKAKTIQIMSELELQSLRAQLNPHFMFNSLNAIQELILKEDNDNSHLYLSRFSELLRMLLDNANQPFVCLRKEINLLELYLSLENLRIPDLKYTIEIDPGIDSNRIAIPNMMLQPYIENAIWHGLSHKKGEKNVNIRIGKNENGIVCEVEDNGVGRKMATELKSLYRKEHRSRGMELLSKRFSLLSKEYGSNIHTSVEDLHDNGIATGTKVTITVPYSLTKQPEPVDS